MQLERKEEFPFWFASSVHGEFFIINAQKQHATPTL